MVTLNYLAYGSNLHPRRLMERVPSAKFVDVTRLNRHELAFHKRGRDGSAKCNLSACSNAENSVFCAIYEIDAKEKPALDEAEGSGFGYLETQLQVRHNGTLYVCFTYLAQQSHIAFNLKPYHWYKEMVHLGAEYLGFPRYYLDAIASIESAQDPDIVRMQENQALLTRMREYR